MIPPRSILAATDFSEPSRTALIFAARLARHCQAALHVTHAEHPLLRAAAANKGINLAAETTGELQHVIAGAIPAADCSPQMHVQGGNPVDVILDVARRLHADVVVVGSHGMSGTQKLMFGSTTEGLLRRSDVSVLVVPGGWTPPRPGGGDLAGSGPVIAGIDMTDSSTSGARAACGLALALGTAVEIVHIVPDLPVLARWQPHAADAMQERVDEARKDVEGVVRHLGCMAPFEWRVEIGSVADQLASIAERAGNRALLVLGKKAPHSSGSAPGTIAYRLLSRTAVPVLMYIG